MLLIEYKVNIKSEIKDCRFVKNHPQMLNKLIFA